MTNLKKVVKSTVMIEFEDYKGKLNNLRQPLADLGAALKLDEARNEVEKLEE